MQEDYDRIAQELGQLYEQWQANKLLFSACGKRRETDPNEAFYYQLREMFNHERPSPFSYATLYYALNKLSFSAVRYNSQGKMNVPYGHRQSFAQTLKVSHHNLLKQTDIQNADYTELFKQATSKDFLFLDPPYDTRFTQYGNLVDFKEDEQLRLAADFKNLDSPALMIIGKTPLISELYQGSIYGSYEKRYAQNFSRVGRSAKPATHLIVSNYL